MSQHQWGEPDKNGVRSCLRSGCTVRDVQDGACWQRKKGGHWRMVEIEPMPDCTSPAPFMSKVVRVTPGATVHARQVVTVAAHPASVDGSAGLALLESDAAPGHGGPLAKVREVLERLAEVGHPMGTGGRTAAQGLAALAPLERALPELLDTYHIANLHQHGPGRATWEGCSKCTALLEGTTP